MIKILGRLERLRRRLSVCNYLRGKRIKDLTSGVGLRRWPKSLSEGGRAAIIFLAFYTTSTVIFILIFTMSICSKAYGALGVTLSPTKWQVQVGLSSNAETSGDHFTVQNTGSGEEDIYIRLSDSEDWTAGTVPGADIFAMSMDTSGSWTTLGKSYGATPERVVGNLNADASHGFDLKLQTPTSDSSSGATQLINLSLLCFSAGEYTYNPMGDFYWKDTGEGIWQSDWSGAYDTNFPNEYATCMATEAVTAGWGTLDSYLTDEITGSYWVGGNTVTMENPCPYCGETHFRSTITPYMAGFPVTVRNRLGWNSSLSNAELAASVIYRASVVGAHHFANFYQYNVTHCANCGSVVSSGQYAHSHTHCFTTPVVISAQRSRLVILD